MLVSKTQQHTRPSLAFTSWALSVTQLAQASVVCSVWATLHVMCNPHSTNKEVTASQSVPCGVLHVAQPMLTIA